MNKTHTLAVLAAMILSGCGGGDTEMVFVKKPDPAPDATITISSLNPAVPIIPGERYAQLAVLTMSSKNNHSRSVSGIEIGEASLVSIFSGNMSIRSVSSGWTISGRVYSQGGKAVLYASNGQKFYFDPGEQYLLSSEVDPYATDDKINLLLGDIAEGETSTTIRGQGSATVTVKENPGDAAMQVTTSSPLHIVAAEGETVSREITFTCPATNTSWCSGWVMATTSGEMPAVAVKLLDQQTYSLTSCDEIRTTWHCTISGNPIPPGGVVKVSSSSVVTALKYSWMSAYYLSSTINGKEVLPKLPQGKGSCGLVVNMGTNCKG